MNTPWYTIWIFLQFAFMKQKIATCDLSDLSMHFSRSSRKVIRSTAKTKVTSNNFQMSKTTQTSQWSQVNQVHVLWIFAVNSAVTGTPASLATFNWEPARCEVLGFEDIKVDTANLAELPIVLINFPGEYLCYARKRIFWRWHRRQMSPAALRGIEMFCPVTLESCHFDVNWYTSWVYPMVLPSFPGVHFGAISGCFSNFVKHHDCCF